MATSQTTCIGLIELNHFSITAMVADYIAKAARVRLLGLEPTGTEGIMIRVGGKDVGAVQAALEAATEEATRLGTEVVTRLLAAPDPRVHTLNAGPVVINGLYGGREEMRPDNLITSKEQTPVTTPQKAIGILETQGLTAILQATDTMLKAADVRLVGKEKIGAAYVTIVIEGDVAAVTAAIQAGSGAVGNLGKLIAAQVIARPHADLMALMPK